MPRDQNSERLSTGTFLIVAFLTVAVTLSASPASADWFGTVISERPAGQSRSNGLLDGFGSIVVFTGEELVFIGHGQTTLTLTSDTGVFVDEVSCSGGISVSFAFSAFTGIHGASIFNTKNLDRCFLNILTDTAGDVMMVEMLGAYSCGGTSGCNGGSQNGKLVFQLTAGSAPR